MHFGDIQQLSHISQLLASCSVLFCGLKLTEIDFDFAKTSPGAELRLVFVGASWLQKRMRKEGIEGMLPLQPGRKYS